MIPWRLTFRVCSDETRVCLFLGSCAPMPRVSAGWAPGTTSLSGCPRANIPKHRVPPSQLTASGELVSVRPGGGGSHSPCMRLCIDQRPQGFWSYFSAQLPSLHPLGPQILVPNPVSASHCSDLASPSPLLCCALKSAHR